MEMTNYQKALLIVHDLEDQFGSISKVPESNPKMQEIHKLLPIGRQSEDTNYDRACWLNRQGYSNVYIAQVTHHSKAAISKYFATYHIKPKQIFKYLVKSANSTAVYYGTSLTHLASLLLHKTVKDTVTARKQLNMHGFSIKASTYIWHKIPDGAYYTLNYLDKFVIKNGINSYIYPNA